MTMPCNTKSKPLFSPRKVYTCSRDEEHNGPHQTMPLPGPGGHLWVTEWSESGVGSQWRAIDTRRPWLRIQSCASCGLRFRPEANYYTKGGDSCFTCVFWSKRMAQYINGEIMVIEGTVYSWGPEHGYGGREFSIITEAGVTTQRGLWCGGDVPTEYRDVLRDNASWSTTSQRP